MKDYKNHIVKYTVELNNLKEGTITAVELPEIKIGDFANNVQFVDEFGNKMGRNGTVIAIKKIEFIA